MMTQEMYRENPKIPRHFKCSLLFRLSFFYLNYTVKEMK